MQIIHKSQNHVTNKKKIDEQIAQLCADRLANSEISRQDIRIAIMEILFDLFECEDNRKTDKLPEEMYMPLQMALYTVLIDCAKGKLYRNCFMVEVKADGSIQISRPDSVDWFRSKQ